jgi:hypothetical protein
MIVIARFRVAGECRPITLVTKRESALRNIPKFRTISAKDGPLAEAPFVLSVRLPLRCAA